MAEGTPPAARPAAPLKLSLAQALTIGLRNSLALRSKELFVQENQALVGLARTRFLPKLDLVGLGSYGQVGTSIGFISNLSSIGDLNVNLGIILLFAPLAKAMEAGHVRRDAVQAVLEDLLRSEGSEIYVKPLSFYAREGQPTTFEQLTLMAKARNELAIGIQIHVDDASQRYGLVLNPKDRTTPIVPKPGDRLVVLAEEDG